MSVVADPGSAEGAVSAIQRRVPITGGEIAVHELGSGPVLGYLHGLTGNPVVHPFLTDLATDHRVIAPSLPGFDASDTIPARTLHDWVFLTSETIDAVGLTGTPVIASSVGAMLALELAAVRPEAFSSLILLAPLGLWDDREPVHDIWSERSKKQPEFLFADPERFDRLTADPDGLDTAELMEREIGRYRTRRSAASLMWPIPDKGLAERIHRVRCPVHLVWGSGDRLVPRSYADRFARSLQECRGVTVIDGAGHAVEWDQPGPAAAAVRSGPEPM